MMGIHQRQGELWAKAIDLGSRLPEDHLLRRLDKVLDLSFVREEVASFYVQRGNVSIDPVVLMRLMLLLFLDNVRSERELMRMLPLRIDSEGMESPLTEASQRSFGLRGDLTKMV